MARHIPAPAALPMLPSRALLVLLRGMRKRMFCGLRHGHVPEADDGYGYVRCQLCGAWIL